MVTKQSGGKITGLLALTMEAQEAMRVGDWAHITGDYEVGIADGTRAVLGHVSVSNHNRRVSDSFSTSVSEPNVPGAVTVEARGFYVKEANAGGAIEAGVEVSVNADGDVVTFDAAAAGADRATVIGVSLTSTAAAGERLDVLVR